MIGEQQSLSQMSKEAPLRYGGWKKAQAIEREEYYQIKGAGLTMARARTIRSRSKILFPKPKFWMLAGRGT